jgi:hypothetical protein
MRRRVGNEEWAHGADYKVGKHGGLVGLSERLVVCILWGPGIWTREKLGEEERRSERERERKSSTSANPAVIPEWRVRSSSLLPSPPFQ